MERKQLEQCAWEAKPRTFGRERQPTRRLRDRKRELLVFHPRKHRLQWAPMWALTDAELQERCEQGAYPPTALRPPYSRLGPKRTF
jgi:hypothetical protein